MNVNKKTWSPCQNKCIESEMQLKGYGLLGKGKIGTCGTYQISLVMMIGVTVHVTAGDWSQNVIGLSFVLLIGRNH